jgi:hypothetical protein
MGFFYFDESIHERQFILGTFVYSSKNLDAIIKNAYAQNCLNPSTTEFKSSCRMANDNRLTSLRESLRSILSYNCRIAVAVIPSHKRSILGKESLLALQQIIERNNISGNHNVYFDEGIFSSKEEANKQAKDMIFGEGITFHFEANSKHILGIQLADLAAHTCSIMLLYVMGLRTKLVKLGKEAGHEPPIDVPLGWEMWATTRYNYFFSKVVNPDSMPEAVVYPNGLYISRLCSRRLRHKAKKCFGRSYLGCIH